MNSEITEILNKVMVEANVKKQQDFMFKLETDFVIEYIEDYSEIKSLYEPYTVKNLVSAVEELSEDCFKSFREDYKYAETYQGLDRSYLDEAETWSDLTFKIKHRWSQKKDLIENFSNYLKGERYENFL